MIKRWIEAARPRTLFVSMAPVLMGCVLAWNYDTFSWIPAVICLIFALLAQIASNFINDYADYHKGADRDDRMGPPRAVALGLISPQAMLRATLITIGCALLLGLWLIHYGGWWLMIVGALVAVFAFGYSCGPYPLSYHGLGDVAVLVFFGIVPVTLTYYVQAHLNPQVADFPKEVIIASLATGLVAINLLIVNNYRDYEADRVSKKNTTVVIFGRPVMRRVYLINCLAAYVLGYIVIDSHNPIWLICSIPFLFVSFRLKHFLKYRKGKALNKVLGMTAMNVLFYVISLSAAIIVRKMVL